MKLTQRQAMTLADYLGVGDSVETEITCDLVNRIIKTDIDNIEDIRLSKEWREYITYHELEGFGYSYGVNWCDLEHWILQPEQELMKDEYAEYDDESRGLEPISYYHEI